MTSAWPDPTGSPAPGSYGRVVATSRAAGRGYDACRPSLKLTWRRVDSGPSDAKKRHPMAHKGHKVIADEGRAKNKAETRPRPTLGALPASCRLHAQHPGRLAPRRTAHKVSIGPCSGMPPHTLQPLPPLLTDPPACTLYAMPKGPSWASWGRRHGGATLRRAPERPHVV